MPRERQVYLLSPRDLSPELIAVTFAKTSRSPESFREIAAELSDASSAEFHEKWVVGYGHASVAEHAVLHVAIENVSRLAIEAIQSNRLASYTEKSTRYQTWGTADFHVPDELADSPLADTYREIVRRQFDFYARSLDPVKAVVAGRMPRRDGESDAQYDRRIRSKYVDACRFVLPAAALANLGMTANARVFENAIRKWLSHPLAEVRAVGEQVKQVALGETPTLVKYADAQAYLRESEAGLQAWADAHPLPPSDDWLRLVDVTPDAEARVLAALLYRFGQGDFAAAQAAVAEMDASTRKAALDEALGRLGKHDTPLRELEYVYYTFDALMDQGAYFEVKRHRIMTQSVQRLTTRQGWTMPKLIAEAGLANEYQAVMAATGTAYEALAAAFPHAASYVVPNAFKRRLLMQFNLREAYHFVQLRSAPNAHFSVRRLAMRMHAMLHAVHPTLVGYMPQMAGRPDWQTLGAEHFAIS